MMQDQPDDKRRGWIKLWRKWQDHEMARDANATLVFLHLLVEARREPKPNRRYGYTLERGQCDLTQEQLAERTNLTRNQIREALGRLSLYGTIKTQSKNHRIPTITTIVNFDTYNQCDESTTIKPPRNHQETTTPLEVEKVEKVEKEATALTATGVAVTKDEKPKAPKATKTHWSEPLGQQLSLLPDGAARKVYPFLNKLARQYTEAAVLRALGKARTEQFANWKHAASWLTVVARDSQVTESNAYEDKLDD